jgi:hypothetical protein
MNRRSARTPIATALIALFAAPAASLAQQAPAQAAAPVQQSAAPATTLQEVVVQSAAAREDFNAGRTSISKLPADLRYVPQSVTVVNKALMESQGVSSLADALRNVPGITIGGAEGSQIGNNINLNGFSARTDIYLDGFRDRGQYYRDTFALDQVEVLMGPSSMLFGRGSTGGVINQVSKKPQMKAATEVTGSVTTNGLVRATADYNTPTGDTSAFRISAMAQDGRPSTRDEMTVQDFGIAPSWRLGIGTPTENHPVGTASAQPRHAGLWLLEPERPSDQCRPQHLLRLHQRPHQPGHRVTERRHHAQVFAQPAPAQPDAVQLRGNRCARNRAELGRLGQCTRLHAADHQCPADGPAVRAPAEPRPQDPRLFDLQPDRTDRQLRHRLSQAHAAGRR